MIITVAGFKGGVGKTTTALHIAAMFATSGNEPVLLVDGDPNHSSLNWSKRGNLPFEVCSLMAAPKASKKAEHIIIDTEGHPDPEDIADFADSSDLVILPTTPDALAVEAVINAVESFEHLSDYGVVLTMVDSRKRATAELAREALEKQGIPVYSQTIRRYTAYEKAALEGVPVYAVKDRFSKIAWGEYKNLSLEIVKG